MANYLKVTPAKLTATASTFESQASSVQNLTNQMMSIVTGLTGAVWSGEAQTSYLTKFHGLEDDMSMLYKMIKEHAEDLIQIAKTFEDAERKNVDAAGGLNSNPIA